MKVQAKKSMRMWMMREVGGGAVEIKEGSVWIVLATIPCPEEFAVDYEDEDTLPNYYVLWNGKSGFPIVLPDENFEVIG